MRIFTFLYIITFLSSVLSDNNFSYDRLTLMVAALGNPVRAEIIHHVNVKLL